MAKSKSFLGDINIHNFKLGTKDVKLYLGDNLIYPTSTSLADAVVTCGSATYNAQTQIAEEITVVLSGNTLTKGVDYNVTQNSGGINVGNYTVEVTGINNYEGTANGTFTINKVTPTVTAPTPLTSLVYNSNAQALINNGSTNWGTLQYSLDNSTYSASIPSGTNATAYTVYYRVVGDSNINDVAAQSVSVSISKANPTYTAPTAKSLTYNGSAQSLLNAGSTNHGTIQYSSDGSNWGTTIPSQTNANTYTTYWKLVGDTNHNDVSSTSISTTIAKANQSAPTATGAKVYEGSTATATASGGGGQGSLEWSNGSTRTTIGSQTTKARWSGNGNYNASSWSNEVTLEVIEKVVVVAKYNVTSTSSPTPIIGQHAGSPFSEIEIDGVELPSVVSAYTFSTAGEHTVKYTLTNQTSIGDYAFDGCSGLTSVIIPNSVTSIGGSAFGSCSSLTSIDIPNSVTSIGAGAFAGCYGLTSVTIGNSVTIIGGGAFRGCSSLTSIDIPNSVTSIGSEAFSSCSGLISIEIPDSVTSIGSYAFLTCSGLTSVTIGNSVTSIGTSAFNTCSSLTSVTIGNSVTSIGEGAFNRCSSLTSCTIGSGVTSIGNSAFYYCSSLTSINIPSGVTSISAGAFEGCSGLTSIDIPSGVTSIGRNAFSGCRSLTSIDIPSGVTSIGNSAFYNCTSLTSIVMPNSVTSIGTSAFQYCSSFTSVNIPNNVTSIGNWAFYGCSGLTSCTIGSGVTSIGGQAFYQCRSLTSIVSNATTASTIQSNTFQDVKAGGTLTVPIGSSGYDVWMGRGGYYLGYYGWTKVEQ